MSMLADVRHALRGLMRAPALSIAAVLCLGLGIGATTSIYSAVHTALVRPLPFPEADRLVTIFRTSPFSQTWPFSPANFLDLRAGARTLERMAAIGQGAALLQGAGEPVRVSEFTASDGLFALLGTRPLLGRTLRDGDEAYGAPPVALLTEEIWRDRFGADPSVVGTTVRLDGEAHEIVGVLPRGFRVPHGTSVLEADVWTPLRFSPQQAAARRSNSLLLLGRLAPGATVESAHEELGRIMDGIIADHPVLDGEYVRAVALRRESTRAVRGPLLLLMGAVGFVLLIAVANVASLLLARGIARRGEFAMRAVLGARDWSMIRPALTESAVLTAAGMALGLALSWAGVRAIRALVPAQLPQLETLSIDGGVLGFTILIAALVAGICGLAPALQAGRSDPQDALRSSGRTGAGRRQQVFLRALVTAEVALSLVLLLGAGLVLRGFESLVGRDPGFDPAPLLTLTVNVPADRYPQGDANRRFLPAAIEAVRAVPGVVAAGSISLIPYQNWGWNFNIHYEGRDASDPARLPLVDTRVADAGLFDALGLELVRGRLFTSADEAPDAPVVVIANQALAERDFPGEDPIGKRFLRSDTSYATIVGVVNTIRNAGPDGDPRPEVYWNAAQVAGGTTAFPMIIRVEGIDPASVARGVTAAIRGVDPDAAVSGLRPMEDVIASSVGRPRFYLALMAIFAVVALLLAGAGLYGIMSYVVAQRTREIGIRGALGSSPRRTVGLVARQGMMLIAIGSVAGLLAGAALTRLLASALYGVSPLDPATFTLVTVVIGLAGALAVALPATRAARIDPMKAMRAE